MQVSLKSVKEMGYKYIHKVYKSCYDDIMKEVAVSTSVKPYSFLGYYEFGSGYEGLESVIEYLDCGTGGNPQKKREFRNFWVNIFSRYCEVNNIPDGVMESLLVYGLKYGEIKKGARVVAEFYNTLLLWSILMHQEKNIREIDVEPMDILETLVLNEADKMYDLCHRASGLRRL